MVATLTDSLVLLPKRALLRDFFQAKWKQGSTVALSDFVSFAAQYARASLVNKKLTLSCTYTDCSPSKHGQGKKSKPITVTAKHSVSVVVELSKLECHLQACSLENAGEDAEESKPAPAPTPATRSSKAEEKAGDAETQAKEAKEKATAKTDAEAKVADADANPEPEAEVEAEAKAEAV